MMKNEELIIGAGNIEQNMSLSGNVQLNQGKKIYQYRGGKMRNREGVEVEISEHAPVSPYAYKYILNLQDKPVDLAQLQALNPNLRTTKGLYMIKYTPLKSKDAKKGRPWKIGQDLIRWDIRVAGKSHFRILCDKVPELGWLRRNSTFSDKLFDISRDHPGMTFWFSVDWVRYVEKLQAQSSSVLRSPFVSRKSSVEDYLENAKSLNDKALLLRCYNDILKEINDAEKEPAVQEEMLEFSGETYDRSRKLNRDPNTGQFIKKDNKEE